MLAFLLLNNDDVYVNTELTKDQALIQSSLSFLKVSQDRSHPSSAPLHQRDVSEGGVQVRHGRVPARLVSSLDRSRQSLQIFSGQHQSHDRPEHDDGEKLLLASLVAHL